MQAFDLVMPWVVAGAVLMCAVIVAGGLVMLVREHHRHLSNDWCRVCLADLPVGKVYEERLDLQDADDGEGGTFVAATYCRRHAPAGAVRV